MMFANAMSGPCGGIRARNPMILGHRFRLTLEFLLPERDGSDVLPPIDSEGNSVDQLNFFLSHLEKPNAQV
jgi:hypothetical protein